MNFIAEFIEKIDWLSIFALVSKIIIILVLTWIGRKVIVRLLDHLEHRLISRRVADGEPPTESSKRIQTIMRLIRQGAVLTLWTIVGLITLEMVGVKIGPILAGAGILGLAVGFGAQNLVRDVISGFFLILENQVRVGDVAIINGTGGLVENINFRTLVLRDLAGVVHIFPNGAINTLSNMTSQWSAYIFDIGVAYKENTDQVTMILEEICKNMRKDEKYGSLIIEDAEIFGVDKFDDSAVVIKGRIKTKPISQWVVGREFLRRVKLAFDEKGIEIPFPHQTLYFGEASKAFELSIVEKLAQKKGMEE